METYGLGVHREKQLIGDHGETICPEMKPVQYEISFRLWHPTMKPEEISSNLGWQPEIAWCAGQARKTPKGTVLEGTYQNTYWNRKHRRSESSVPLSDAVADFLEDIESRSSFLQFFSAGGGTAELFFIWFGRGGFTLPCTLLAKLSDLKIGLSFDIYDSEDQLATGSDKHESM